MGAPNTTMDEDAAQSGLFAEGLTYQERLPVTWRMLDEPLTERELAHYNESNEAVLNTIAALEEHHPELHEGQHGHELARLDFKLNLLLDLVGQLITQNVELPAPTLVKLGAHAIAGYEKLEGSPPPLGRHFLVSVYLHAGYPRPTVLPARLVAAEASGPVFLLAASLEGLSESVHDLLEKFIFRHHRRTIAHTRHSSL